MNGSVGIVGAGTMGAGIAQIAAVAGRKVLIADAVPGAAARAVDGIRDRVKAQVARGRLTVDPDALDLTALDDPVSLDGCAVVIEAIIEDLAVKRALFAQLEAVVADDTILASNTSSLSPTALAAGLAHPERLVGLHFFNPVPAMKLVEVISGLATAPEVADAAADLAVAWGKTVVRSTATPGFIVNRIARPFYAEAWRLYEEHATVAQNIDAVLTGAGGFRMGPFALMDLIGHDVNEAVTRSVWAAFSCDPRFAPALAQRALVEAGWLGRKSGRGIYPADGAPAATPAPAAPPPHAVTVIGPAVTGQAVAGQSVTGPVPPAGDATLPGDAAPAGDATLPGDAAPAGDATLPGDAAPAGDSEREPSPLRVLLDRAGVAIVAGNRDGTVSGGTVSGGTVSGGTVSAGTVSAGTVPGDGDGDGAGLPGGLVELPSGALLTLSEGTTATALAAAFGRPVIVADRFLDPATATAVAIAPSDGCPPAAAAEAVGLLQAAGLDVYVIDDTPGLIVTRTVAMLANLAADALAGRVASEPDLDTAMRLGVNYPLGPLAWARRWGTGTVLRILDNLEDWYRDGRYRPSPLLRRAAWADR